MCVIDSMSRPLLQKPVRQHKQRAPLRQSMDSWLHLWNKAQTPFPSSLLLTHLLGAYSGYATHNFTKNWPPVSYTKDMDGHWPRSNSIDLGRNTELLAVWATIRNTGHQMDFYNSLLVHRQCSVCSLTLTLTLPGDIQSFVNLSGYSFVNCYTNVVVFVFLSTNFSRTNLSIFEDML